MLIRDDDEDTLVSVHDVVPATAESEVTPIRVRWHLALPAVIALMSLLLGGAVVAWWMSRPTPVSQIYAGSSGAATVGESAAGSPADSAPSSPASSTADDLAASTTVVVYIVGQVKHPGVVSVGAHARLVDVVAAAGGLTKKADATAVNLARAVVDGEQITIPTRGRHTQTSGTTLGEEASDGTGGGATGKGSSGATPSDASPLNLNSADLAALESLPGIGPALAQRIVDWRESQGSFTSVEQLNEVSGIGDVTYARLKDLVRV